MSYLLDALVQQLALERIEQNLFRGQSVDIGSGSVFGGQVLGQALSAAVQTVPEERHVHSLHAYFLRPGDVTRPIVYDVDRIRDGTSFTTRRVVAIQAGRAIFNLAASFQKREPGFEHQEPMPAAPPPESVAADVDDTKVPEAMRTRAANCPFELRTIERQDDWLAPAPLPPQRRIWMRARGQLPDSPALHAYLLAYASDYSFLTTALLPHGATWSTPGLQSASLDHVMWFHRPLRVDDWFLYVIDSPAASGARGLVRGSVFTRDGRLVANTAQQGLLRMHPSDLPLDAT